MIGRYKLLERVGEGGFGVVYVAEQQEPVKRRVALKIIKLGMDTRQVVARFEAERQALALMDHPNIAKVLDAGATATGRPYFLMELVRGIKFTDYCDQNNLSTRARLELFVRVCHAIQHAHQKGIIHRDIKPSNILVTLHDGVPVPKVIDFGIAKATQGELTDKTVYTQLQQFVGTPAYMSPEQAEMSGLDIDTRSDIYSLGVLLYELLTGLTPFDQHDLLKAGVDGMRRMIRELEPVRPSTRVSSLHGEERTTTAKRRGEDAPRLIHLLRGDLDWIVMKALEKDRTRRYETANGLAMDIGRYLSNEPVVARPPSKLYRFQKMARRNKLAFAAASAVAAALVLGLGVSTWMFLNEKAARKRAVIAEREARQARANEAGLRETAQNNARKAETEAAKSRQVTHFLQEILKGVGPGVAMGRDLGDVFKDILDKTAAQVGKEMTNQPEVAIELVTTLGDAYEAVGEYPKAEKMYSEGLRLKEGLGSKDKTLGYLLNHLGLVLWENRELPEAEATQLRALEVRKSVSGADSEDVAESENDLALVRWQQGDLAGAEALFRHGLALRDKLPEPEKSAAPNQKEVAVTLGNLAQVLHIRGDLPSAEMMQRQTLGLRTNLFPEGSGEIAQTLNSLAWVLMDRGNLAEAEPCFRDSLRIVQKVLREQHPNLALASKNLGVLLRRRGSASADVSALREALQRYPADVLTADAFACLLARPALTPVSPDSSASGWRYTRAQPAADWTLPDFSDKDWLSAPALFGGPASWGRTLRNPPAVTTRTNLWLRREFQLSAVPAGRLALRINRNQDAQVFLNGVQAATAADWSDTEVLLPCSAAGQTALKPGRNVLAVLCQDADGGTRIDVGLYAASDETLGRKQLLQELNQLVEQEPKRADLFTARANALARLGRWQEAAADLAKAVELRPSAEINWCQLAPLLVETGDLAGYRSHCRGALAQFAQPDGPDQAGEISKLSLLIPAEGTELRTAAKLADAAGAAEYREIGLGPRQLAKGLSEYRQGNFAVAIGWMDKALATCAQQDLPGWNHERERNRSAMAQAVQAMAHQHLKRSAEARTSLTNAAQIVQTRFPQLASGDVGREWQEWLTAHILLREAQGLVEKAPAADKANR